MGFRFGLVAVIISISLGGWAQTKTAKVPKVKPSNEFSVGNGSKSRSSAPMVRGGGKHCILQKFAEDRTRARQRKCFWLVAKGADSASAARERRLQSEDRLQGQQRRENGPEPQGIECLQSAGEAEEAALIMGGGPPFIAGQLD